MEKDFIVAIELGSSKITGIAGKKNNNDTMHILAYATEKTASTCIKRGMVYNRDKTTQCINNIINKLQTTLKTQIHKVYVGVGGQSVRSYKCVIKRNLLAKSSITSETIDSMRDESYTIPYSDCEVLDNFAQEYTVDQSVVIDPVGIIGENIEGEYLNIIARNTLKDNIRDCFANANIQIADELLAPCQLANNILTDIEKRSGCALIDLGSGTTTVIVYKNNIVRHLATIPLGQNNITQDMKEIFQLDDNEAEAVKIKFANASIDSIEKEKEDEKEPRIYTTSDGRQLEVSKIQNVIEARVNEIIGNIKAQIIQSSYDDKLIAGIIITGGGSNMKDIDKAISANTLIDKTRIAKGISTTAITCSNQINLKLDDGMSNTLLSILLAGTENCAGEEYNGMVNIFDQSQKEEENKKKREEAAAQASAETEATNTVKEYLDKIRTQINKVTAAKGQISSNRSDKKLREKAEETSREALFVLDDKYNNAIATLEGKDKFRMAVKEAKDLEQKLNDEVESLNDLIAVLKNENSMGATLRRWWEALTSEND